MEAGGDEALEGYVYLRVHKKQWKVEGKEPEPIAFELRPKQPTASVFCADLQSPRGVLQRGIDFHKECLKSDDPEVRSNSERFLHINGDTVEDFIQKGWRVAIVPAAAYSDRGFEFSPPEEDGHQNVKGKREDFLRHSGKLAESAVVLSAEECRKEVDRATT